ncbi:MAG: hypothetical protein DRN13_03260 [Thermoplasmata archaeon]|nr:MAG: hypothetical protein DRN13_03260 [Thermoplasmata archaeon]
MTNRWENTKMEVRDPIYGFIEYDDKEEQIINTRVFQRLRGIKQLALASLVYPGAHHTRFEHSLGVMHLAGKIGSQLGLDDDRVKILRLAGLLHDIGHGPFSHVSEQIIEDQMTDSKKILDKYNAQNVQELLSILLIENNDEIKAILSDTDIDSVTNLLKKEKRGSIEKNIISGPLDADKIDYIFRDAYFAGVKYGVFDLEKVIESLTPIPIGRESHQLGITEEGVYAVEQLLLAKYHMNVQVYKHRIRRIADAMLVKGIEYAIEEGIEEIKGVYDFEDSSDFLSKFIEADDNDVVKIILDKSKGTAGEIFKRIVERRLFKEIYQIDVNNENFTDDVSLMNAGNPSSDQREQITAKIAKLLDVPPQMVIFDLQSITNPTFKLPRVTIDTVTIMVNRRSGDRSFPNVSQIFNNPSVDLEKTSIHIYAPLDRIGTREERNKFIEGKYGDLDKIIRGELR